MILSLEMARQVPVLFVSYDYAMPILAKNIYRYLPILNFRHLWEQLLCLILHRINKAEKELHTYSLALQSPIYQNISAMCLYSLCGRNSGVKVVYIDYAITKSRHVYKNTRC